VLDIELGWMETSEWSGGKKVARWNHLAYRVMSNSGITTVLLKEKWSILV
jgi:hypothetical protein